MVSPTAFCLFNVSTFLTFAAVNILHLRIIQNYFAIHSTIKKAFSEVVNVRFGPRGANGVSKGNIPQGFNIFLLISDL